MKWTKPEAKDICLGLEVTAYVNSGESRPAAITRKPAKAAK